MFNHILSYLAAIAPLHGDSAVIMMATVLGTCLPALGMALTITAVRNKSQSLYRALATVAWDNKYLATGEVFDVSSIMVNRVFGAIPIAATVNDYTGVAMFVQGSSQSPSTGVIQLYQSTTGAPAALVEVANDTDVSARNGETWEIVGD